jgi:hypothetical protein
MFKPLIFALIVFLAVFSAIGCSGGNNPATSPVEPVLSVEADNDAQSSRQLWGVWEAGFDWKTKTVFANPARNVDAHYKINSWLLPPACDNCFVVEVNSYEPTTHILDVDVTLRNPTQMAGFDVRGILYVTDAGYLLTNADAWTPVFDIGGGEDINPFKAYAKNMPHRIFFPNNLHKQNYLIFIPDIIDLGTMYFAVTASYPDNCKEPYKFENFSQDVIFDISESPANVYIDVFDWQSDVSAVEIYVPCLNHGKAIPFSLQSGQTWVAEVNCEGDLMPGSYRVLIKAVSGESGLALYDYYEIEISEKDIVFSLEDVTPPWLQFKPYDICVEGAFAYVACREKFVIVDASDPSNPEPVKVFEGIQTGQRIDVSNGYAYLCGANLCIYDIDPPEDACLIKTIDYDPNPYTCDIAVEDGFVYIAANLKLYIVDVSPPESASIVNTIQTISGKFAIDVSGGYVFIADTLPEPALKIIDIDPPEQAQLIKTVELTCGVVKDMKTWNGYAYVAGSEQCLQIVDIEPLESAAITGEIEMSGTPLRMDISEGYAFVETDELSNDKINIIELNPPDSGTIIKFLYTSGASRSLAASGGYLFETAYDKGIKIIDIDPIMSASEIGAIYTVNDPRGIAVSGDYAYVADCYQGLKIIDVSTPESSWVVSAVETSKQAAAVTYASGYAYLSEATDGLKFIDVSQPGSPVIVNSFNYDPSFEVYDSAVCGDYAYFVDQEEGVHIFNIDPPELAQWAGYVETGGEAYGIAASNGHAYIANYHSSIEILDTEPIEAAEVINSIAGSHIKVASSGDYLFASCVTALKIIDISDPYSPLVINIVDDIDSVFGLAVYGGYAFTVGHSDWMHIIDIYPPETAHVVKSYQKTWLDPRYIDVTHSIACVSDYSGKLWIIKLW